MSHCLKSIKSVFLIGLILFLLIAAAIVWDGLTDEIGVSDAAIVFGNAVLPDGQPSARLEARLDKTIELFKKGFFSEIIVSGGRGKEGFDEAQIMMQYLISKGIPGDSIIVDSGGVDTFSTAKNASGIMERNKMQSVIVISQYFHIPRAKLALSRFGISAVYSAHADYFELRDIYSIGREVFALGFYIFRSYQ